MTPWAWGISAVRRLGIVLPPGISFYTFQAMSYTVDVYRGHAKPTRSFSRFRPVHLLLPAPGGRSDHAGVNPAAAGGPTAANPIGSLGQRWYLLILVSMFKNIVVADNMAPIASHMFCQYAGSTGTLLTAPEILLGIYAFAFQIYGDFSGYSSIARDLEMARIRTGRSISICPTCP